MNTPEFPPPSGEAFPNAPAPTGQALDAVKLPAIFLIVIGAIGVLLALWGIVQGAMGGNEAEMARIMNDPNIPAAAKQWLGFSQKGGMFINAFVLLTSALVIYGSTQMMKLKNFGLSMAAAIIAMIPCFGPCCCLGLPVGIWALVVLNKPEVKASFT